MTLSLQYKGFDYVAFFNGAYEDSDSLPQLAQTGADSIEATLDYGIDVNTSQVVADPNYTDSLAALGSTIAQAEQLGLTVMVRPLIDFLDPSEIGGYSVGEWRQDYEPSNVATFFASYQQMIVAEAKVAQSNGAQMLSIGAELDQLAGPQYLSYWTSVIDAVRAVFSGKLTYSASWQTAGNVSFWNQLDYEGIDCYVPLSTAANPTLQELINGWTQPATPSTNPDAYAFIGNQSPIRYFENLSAQSGKPLLFTELGYANDSGAAAAPYAEGNSPDPSLQAELYQAFFDAWQQSGNTSLVGTYFWEWDPNSTNGGPGIDSFSPQNNPAQSVAASGFAAIYSTSTWANAVNGSFATAANWNPANVPGANNDVGITAGDSYTVSSAVSETVDSLTLATGATLAVTGGTFTVTDASQFQRHVRDRHRRRRRDPSARRRRQQQRRTAGGRRHNRHCRNAERRRRDRYRPERNGRPRQRLDRRQCRLHGANAALILHQEIGGQILGAAATDSIDATFVSFTVSEHAVWQQASSAGGTLSLYANGAELASFNLTGQYNSLDFNVSNDGGGNALVTMQNTPNYPENPGNNDEWILSDGQWAESADPGSHPAGYSVAGIGDWTGSGTDGILWFDPSTSDTDEWQLSNTQWSASVDLGSHPGNYQISGNGDFWRRPR